MRKTTAELILRPRRPTDDAFIFRLSDRIFAPYSIHPRGSMASMLAESGAVAMIAERAREAFGAYDTRAPVGFFVVAFERVAGTFGPWQRPVLSRLNAIGVDPALHGKGIGRFLLEHAEHEAREGGAVSLTLMTAETNTRARRLFASSGFQRLFVLEGSYARGQRGIVMTKVL